MNHKKKEMSEIDFAGVIGISYGSYQTIKHTDRRAKILKTENIQEEITEERKVEIVNELKEKGYTNKLINYPEFLELYELYKQEIKENQMAEIIGISEVSYSHIKYEGKNTRILKTGKIPEERKEEIVGELKQKGYAYKSIMYQEFLELYEPYKKEMQEQDFASIIIRTYSSYNNMKYRGAKVRILKINYVSKERKVEIINELKGKEMKTNQ